jgi:predicted small metal-binding protein
MFPTPQRRPLDEIILDNVNKSTGYISYLNLMDGEFPRGLPIEIHFQHLASICASVMERDEFDAWLGKHDNEYIQNQVDHIKELYEETKGHDEVADMIEELAESGGGGGVSTYTLRL